MIYKIKKDGLLNGWSTKKVSLEGKQVWLEHPVHGTKIDVVAIPWEQSDRDDLIKPINEIHLDEDLPIQVGMDLFILGYPHGYCPYPQIMPIWKRGSLATEYAIDLDHLPRMYIDSATAKGMSGAPVIAKLTGMYLPEGKEDKFRNYTLSGGRRFLGIYTGRHTDKVTADIKSDIFNAQLGNVWKKSVIEEILNQ